MLASLKSTPEDAVGRPASINPSIFSLISQGDSSPEMPKADAPSDFDRRIASTSCASTSSSPEERTSASCAHEKSSGSTSPEVTGPGHNNNDDLVHKDPHPIQGVAARKRPSASASKGDALIVKPSRSWVADGNGSAKVLKSRRRHTDPTSSRNGTVGKDASTKKIEPVHGGKSPSTSIPPREQEASCSATTKCTNRRHTAPALPVWQQSMTHPSPASIVETPVPVNELGGNRSSGRRSTIKSSPIPPAADSVDQIDGTRTLRGRLRRNESKRHVSLLGAQGGQNALQSVKSGSQKGSVYSFASSRRSRRASEAIRIMKDKVCESRLEMYDTKQGQWRKVSRM